MKEASTLRWGKYERGEKKNSRIIDSAKLAAVGLFFFSLICGNEKKVVKLENPFSQLTAKLILHLNLVKKAPLSNKDEGITDVGEFLSMLWTTILSLITVVMYRK